MSYETEIKTGLEPVVTKAAGREVIELRDESGAVVSMIFPAEDLKISKNEARLEISAELRNCEVAEASFMVSRNIPYGARVETYPTPYNTTERRYTWWEIIF